MQPMPRLNFYIDWSFPFLSLLFFFTLLSPVAITEHPHNQYPHVGDRATFQVKTSGCCLRYQWQQKLENTNEDFQDIPGSRATKPTYTISSVRTNDEGQYQCIVQAHFVSSDSGRATSTPATLKLGEYEFIIIV